MMCTRNQAEKASQETVKTALPVFVLVWNKARVRSDNVSPFFLLKIPYVSYAVPTASKVPQQTLGSKSMLGNGALPPCLDAGGSLTTRRESSKHALHIHAAYLRIRSASSRRRAGLSALRSTLRSSLSASQESGHRVLSFCPRWRLGRGEDLENRIVYRFSLLP